MKKNILAIIAIMFFSFTGCDFSASSSNNALTDPNTNTDTTVYNEGSIAAPVEVTVGNGHSGKVGYGNTYSSITGNPSYSYYKITLSAAGKYKIAVTNVSPASYLDIDLYSNSTFTGLLDYSMNSTTSGVSLTYTFPSAGTYYFEVSNYTDTSNVTYTINVTSETIYNEGTKTTPILLPSGSDYSGKVGFGTEDQSYYKIIVESAVTHVISVSGLSPAADLDIKLYSDNTYTSSSFLWAQLTAVTTGETLTYTFSTPGTYYVLVQNYTNTNNVTYTINAGPTNEGTATNPINVTIAADHSGRVGYSSASRSYYKFVIGTAGQYTMSATALSASVNVDLKLFSDSAFSSLLSSAVGVNTVSLFGDTFAYNFTSTGTYYLAVDNVTNTSNVTYLVNISKRVDVTLLAGNIGLWGFGNGTGASVYFYSPSGVAVDSSGNVYVADTYNHRIRMVTSGGTVTTLAGSGSGTFSDATGTSASFYNPNGITIDSTGTNLYVADTSNNRIRKVVISSGVVTTLAGSSTSGSTDHTTGTSASFNSPIGVTVDSSDNVYVADTGNNKIRKVTSAGVVTTLAGSGSIGSTDGTGTSASFNGPYGIAVDSSGNIYVSDNTNHTIRKVTSAGVVTTLAGKTGFGGSTDGTGTSALFKYPRGLAVDSSGNIYVADYGNSKVRMVTSAGVVTTLVGPGSVDGSGNSAQFSQPYGVTVDSSGNVYTCGQDNSIRKFTP